MDVVVHGSIFAYVTQTCPALARVLDYAWLYCYMMSAQCSDSADLLSARLFPSLRATAVSVHSSRGGAYAHS
jgi:hypothetical protein